MTSDTGHIAQLEAENKRLNDNLQAVQQRCTEMKLALRTVTDGIVGDTVPITSRWHAGGRRYYVDGDFVEYFRSYEYARYKALELLQCSSTY